MADLNDRQGGFYVYVVAVDGRIAYVGKGCGQRMLTHLRNSSNATLRDRVAEAYRNGQKVRARAIKRNLTETEAMQLERALIARHYARLDNASLGGFSAHERLVLRVKQSLSRLKTRQQILDEDTGHGTARADLRDRIEREYQGILQTADEHPEWVTRDGCFQITVRGAHA